MDEYTGDMSPKHLIREAIEDELNDMNGKVWKLSTVSEMEKIRDDILVRSRWVMCNKGDAGTPDCCARLASCELNNDGKVDAFFASTPPLQAKKLLVANQVHRPGKRASSHCDCRSSTFVKCTLKRFQSERFI